MSPRTISSLGLAVLATAAAGLSSGCATKFPVNIDAVSIDRSATPGSAAGAAAAKELTSYKIKNKNPAIDEESLRYKEAVQYVKTALSGTGLYEAATMDTADMIVELDFGLDEPRVHMEEQQVPVYSRAGGGVRYEQIPVTNANGTVTMRTVAVMDPPLAQLIGYNDVEVPVTTYEKYLRISAHENVKAAGGKVPPQIWSVSISSDDESNDLRKYLPLLASASIDYIGTEGMNAKTTVNVREGSDGVVFVKKGM